MGYNTTTNSDDDMSPAFKTARDRFLKSTISGPPKVTYEELVDIADKMGKTFSEMDTYLGLGQGQFNRMVSTAPRSGPKNEM